MTESVQKKEDPKKKDNKFEWDDEGVATLVRVIILAWSGAILTLNYVTIPGVPQRQIDPTFIKPSVFTTTLDSRSEFRLVRKRRRKNLRRKKMRKLLDVLTVVSFLGTAGIIGAGAYVYIQKDALIEGVKKEVVNAGLSLELLVLFLDY